MPDANTLTVGLFAVLAQHERETISKRTKDALAT
jgi:DNA invertase Pin-like site-specific DNA recombinase